MGSLQRRQRERQELRTKIMDAARELFAAHGYEAVTMRKIAERIEYSPTAIYFHFQDKTALVRELVEHDFLAFAEIFKRAARAKDPIERLKKQGYAYAEFGLTHPNHYRLMFMTPMPPAAPGPEDPRHGNPDYDAYALLKETVAEAFRRGRFRPELKDPELIAQTLWAGVHGVVALEIAKSKDEWFTWRPLTDRLRLMVDLQFRGLVKEHGKPPRDNARQRAHTRVRGRAKVGSHG